MTRPPIVVRGARTHNLANVDVTIPSDALVVITGPSGAGKSSLAFDTIYAEAQRRFLEAASTELRAASARLPRPPVDSIEGLSPAIAVDQRALTRSVRSTLGTVSEIADHLRLLYARAGVPRCPICGEVVRAETAQEIVDAIVARPSGTRIAVRAPLVRRAAGDQRALLDRLRTDGFVRAVADGIAIDLGEIEALDRRRFPAPVHDVDVVVDRIVVKDPRDAIRRRASDSIELALRTGAGRVRLEVEEPGGAPVTSWHSERFACEKDDFVFPAVEPSLFSPNAAEGACQACSGLGTRRVATERTLVPDPSRTLRQGAIVAWGPPGSVAFAVEIDRATKATAAPLDVAWSELDEPLRRLLLEGGKLGKKSYEGAIAFVEARLSPDDLASADDERAQRLDDGGLGDDDLDDLREEIPCRECGGTKLRIEARAFEIGGLSIADLSARTLDAARTALARIGEETAPRLRAVTGPLIEATLGRLDALIDVGLGYLSLDRGTRTLSAGEAERARIATQIASGLRGVLYVLDEPSRGLHPRDTERLIATLRRLRDLGSTVLVVEHELSIIAAADHVIDVGPVAGRDGGRIVAEGAPSSIAEDPRSVTGPWLSGAASLPSLARRSVDRARAIRLRGATRNGLRDVDLLVPVGCLTTVTGPSGSGKSSLIMGSLVPAIRAAIAARPTRKGEAARVPRLPSWIAALEGAEAIDRIVAIDQEPLGRSPRATPATATGIMPRLRELFAGLPEAQARGFKPGRFSTNVKGGRCEACLGDGVVRVEMRFLPDVFVECAVCRGARYDRETLEIRWKGHSIAEVLAANVDDCHRLFESVPPIRERLDAMRAVGLGYLALGQPSTTLSGGEAQRVKLARELARARETRARDRGRTEGSTLFVFDEPTTGLHPVDVAILLEAIAALRDEGSTIVVVEHDAAFAARADHVIDLGPGAGPEGGRIVAAGTPEEVANSAGAPTAFALARVLDHGARDADHTPTSPSRMP